MIKKLNCEPDAFVLLTDNTAYITAITPSGHPEHIYYGTKLEVDSLDELEAIRQKREFEIGNGIRYSDEHPKLFLEDVCLEISGHGHGDIREPFIELVRADGSRSTDFTYTGYEIDDTNPPLTDLPSSYFGDSEAQRLRLILEDGPLILELTYCVYPECDVITRRAKLTNKSGERLELERLMSNQLDLPDSGYTVTSFHGAWAREMERSEITLRHGKFVIESRTGCSSNRANPFFMLHEPNAGEDFGRVYGFNLVYSGNHYAAAEVNPYGKTRVVQGVNPSGFRFILAPDESFETPEAVMTFSDKGFGGQTLNMHRFIRKHIVRGEWANKERPVLLNSWEASYFNISESNLAALAKAGKELGVELFVVDDGWFGERSDDYRALGDWEPNPKKLPGGLSRLSKKVRELGLEFGIWVEPEMVNVDSDLYRDHPEWAMAIPDRLHSEGRHQRVLDLSNPKVVDYLTDKMSRVFSSGRVSYVKWDMNRIFSDVFSPYLPAERQGETAHRYIMGLYRMMDRLVKKFPHILFEGCASGGNRFDLGILCYFPQIWGSDNTDALSRARIQEGYSYGYPQSCVGAHVSACPNHQTLRSTPFETRFEIAAFGVLGYELDAGMMPAAEKEQTRLQITLYKAWRDVLQYGDFYRIRSGNVHEWICVSPDRKRAVGLLMQELVEPNTQSERFCAKGLDPDRTYRFHNISGRVNIKLFGSLINTLTPVKIRQDGMLHNFIARMVKMGGEAEDFIVKGSALMTAGIALKQQFSGTGFNENVRVFPDFSARMYFFEAID